MTATLFAGLPGQESGHALTSILYGATNPSGRLPYTIPRSEHDLPDPLLNPSLSDAPFPESNFTEGLFLDYRHFDHPNATNPKQTPPQFEFGFGLSYTTFIYTNLSITPSTTPSTNWSEYPPAQTPPRQGGHPALWDVLFVARCAVANAGAVEGAEVAQLYVGVPGAGVPESEGGDARAPVRQLRGFVRVGPLVPGQAREAVFELTRRDLSVWDVEAQGWRLRRGGYKLWVGASSRDLRVVGEVVVG